MKSAGEAEARKERRTLAILGGILAIGAISCTGVLSPEPIVWQVASTEFWRGPLYRDPGESQHRAKGHVRVRWRTIIGSQYGRLIAIVKEQRLDLAVRGLDRVQSFALSSPPGRFP